MDSTLIIVLLFASIVIIILIILYFRVLYNEKQEEKARLEKKAIEEKRIQALKNIQKIEEEKKLERIQKIKDEEARKQNEIIDFLNKLKDYNYKLDNLKIENDLIIILNIKENLRKELISSVTFKNLLEFIISNLGIDIAKFRYRDLRDLWINSGGVFIDCYEELFNGIKKSDEYFDEINKIEILSKNFIKGFVIPEVLYPVIYDYNSKIFFRKSSKQNIEFYYIFDYLSNAALQNLNNDNPIYNDIRSFIFRFKDGKYSDNLVSHISQCIINIDKNIYNNNNYYICCIPSSKLETNYNRFYTFIQKVSEKLRVNNGYNLIKREFDIEKSIQNGVKNDIDVLKGIIFSESLKDKNIILIDDVITKGTSLLKFNNQLKNKHINTILSIFLCRTYYHLENNLDIDFNINNYDYMLRKVKFREDNVFKLKNLPDKYQNSTYQITYNLLIEGKNINEISKIRNLDNEIIIYHLEKLQTFGIDINIFDITVNEKLIKILKYLYSEKIFKKNELEISELYRFIRSELDFNIYKEELRLALLYEKYFFEF